ncbi:hypothetical protein P2P02_23000, partial [Escherichia coli]
YSAGRAATTGRTGAVFNLQPPGCRGSEAINIQKIFSRFSIVSHIFKRESVCCSPFTYVGHFVLIASI